MELSFLGTGTSVGIPMIGCHCPVCQSKNPKNRRRRSCLYVKTDEVAFVVDTPPDFREQMLDAGIERLDAVLFTHAHADHLFGFDDVRRFNTLSGGVLPAYAIPETLESIHRIFNYIGQKPSPIGLYRPMINFIPVTGPFRIGDVRITPLRVEHGIPTVGYLMESREGRVGYISDCHSLTDEVVEALKGVDVMALNALRYRPHPTHLSLEASLGYLERIGARRSYLIHLCHDMDHDKLASELPPGVFPSYDGLRVSLPEF